MTKGGIVLTPFPFTDLSGTKKRPAVIVSERCHDKDVIVVFISSKIQELSDTDFVLERTHPDFSLTGLKVDSVFKMAKIVTLEKKILFGELGRCSKLIINELDQRLKIAFGL